MKLKGVWEKKGFRELLLKSFLFVGVLAVVQVLIQPLSNATPLPGEFKPFSLIFIEDMIVFVLSVFVVYNWKGLVNVKSYPVKIYEAGVFLLSGGLCVGAYYALKFSLDVTQFFFENVIVFVFLKYLLLSLMVLSFWVAVFGQGMIFDIYRMYRRQVPYLLMVGLGYWSLATFLDGMWSVLSGVVANMVFLLLSLSEENVMLSMSADGPMLSASGFGAIIGALCSGIESMLLFVSLYFIFVAVDKDKINFKRASLVFLPALFGVFVLNVFRIYLLYLAGIYVSKEFAFGMFHTNVGWILFVVYFFVFLYYAYPWMMMRNRPILKEEAHFLKERK